MSHKVIPGSKRVDGLTWDPDALFVVGRDARPDGTVDGPEHCRWDPRALKDPDPEMVDSFKRHRRNFLTVVIVDVDGVAEIDDGRSRVIAAREAQRQLKAEGKDDWRVTISSTLSVRGYSEVEHALLGQELNALRRDDDDMTLCEKACHALRFTDEKGKALTRSRIAKMNGWFTDAYKIDMAEVIVEKASTEVKEALRAGRITMSLAYDIARKPKAEQAESMVKVEAVAAAQPAGKKVSRAAAGREAGVKRETEPAKSTVKVLLDQLRNADGTFVDDELPTAFLLGMAWALRIETPDGLVNANVPHNGDVLDGEALLARATRLLKKANG